MKRPLPAIRPILLLCRADIIEIEAYYKENISVSNMYLYWRRRDLLIKLIRVGTLCIYICNLLNLSL